MVDVSLDESSCFLKVQHEFIIVLKILLHCAIQLTCQNFNEMPNSAIVQMTVKNSSCFWPHMAKLFSGILAFLITF